METERLFLAITLPESVRSRLGESVRLVSQRTERVRWVPRENIHITLKKALNKGLPNCFSDYQELQ